MPYQYFVSQISFSDGSQFAFQEGEFVLLIGPNNAGKSQALRDIEHHSSTHAGDPTPTRVVTQLLLTSPVGKDSVDELIADLEVTPSNPNQVGRMGNVFDAPSLRANALNGPWLATVIHRFFVRRLNASERLSITSPPSNIDIRQSTKSHPYHYLYAHGATERTISDDFRRAFGTDLVVDHFAGASVQLRVGDRPTLGPGEDRLSDGYRTALGKLPGLDEQGDGMRSFAGSLLWTRATDFRVLLIDEPEAFLHPPQARQLGRQIAISRNPAMQIFAASHSGDFLRGVLSSNIDKLRIIRIVRDGNHNAVTELGTEELRRLWADPLIRYSNLLDALFHQQCIICESDGDCLFYAATDQAMEDASGSSSRDTMFASVGGKQRLPVAIQALRRLGIKVKVISDFDVFREESPLKEIIGALGGNWLEIEPLWRSVSVAVSKTKAHLDSRQFKEKIVGLLSTLTSDEVPDKLLKEFRDATRHASAWARAKKIGIASVPNGNERKNCEVLLSRLETLGLFVVSVGELEGFCPTIGGHGPKWVGEVMQRNLATDPELANARTFVSRIMA